MTHWLEDLAIIAAHSGPPEDEVCPQCECVIISGVCYCEIGYEEWQDEIADRAAYPEAYTTGDGQAPRVSTFTTSGGTFTSCNCEDYPCCGH